ncbi:hypothetical protein [Pedobacter alpinus]|uniref:DUF3592 domain-containing protein n=1 Tax=Pedobacter alpinus TaxID=1590643 RepID=A0ABW5TLT6_9SPHI
MSENQDFVSVEPLTATEKAMFFNRMLGVWFFGILMFTFLTFLFFFTKGSDEFMEPSFLWLFPFMFYGVLAFIIYSHTKNAFQSEKTVYNGIITEKTVKASQINRESSIKQAYKICLVDIWFTVESSIYTKVKVGNTVKLHCLAGNQVFSVDVLDSADKAISNAMKPFFNSRQPNKAGFSLLDLIPFSGEDAKLIQKKLLSTIINRSLLGLAAMALIYFIVFLFFVILVKSDNVLLLQGFVYCLLVLLGVVYFLINRKTWKLFRDILDAQKYSISETIIDKVSSTNKKPGPNSVVVINGNTSNYVRYFYLQTTSFWLPVSEIQYQNAKVDEVLKIYLAKNSKTVLNVKGAD